MRAMAVWAAIVSVLAAATLTVAWPRAARVKVPPIPEAGPLAQPKSIHQVGVPAAATRAAIPPDNPQTPEKIALGQKSFFDGRLSADGTVACSTCHDPARAFTDGSVFDTETFNDRYWSASREPQRSMTSRGYDPRQSPGLGYKRVVSCKDSFHGTDLLAVSELDVERDVLRSLLASR